MVKFVKTEEIGEKPAPLQLFAKQPSDTLHRDGTVSFTLTVQQQNIQDEMSVANSQPKAAVSTKKTN
jgi:hypothetical protein